MTGSFDPKKTLDSIGLGKSEQKRSTRVADTIRKELAILILTKIRDPKLAGVSVSRVEVSDDLSSARIFFTVLGGDQKVVKAATLGLERAKGFMRTHLARTLNMRYTPALQFRYDEIAEKVEHLENIFQEIASERDCGEENS
jgi:ribosome-binding factor A